MTKRELCSPVCDLRGVGRAALNLRKEAAVSFTALSWNCVDYGEVGMRAVVLFLLACSRTACEVRFRHGDE